MKNLTDKEISEGNKLIAKFLGWFQDKKIHGNDTWFIKSDSAIQVVYAIYQNYPHRDLPFHRDWNYLIPALNKLRFWRSDNPKYNKVKMGEVIVDEFEIKRHSIWMRIYKKVPKEWDIRFKLIEFTTDKQFRQAVWQMVVWFIKQVQEK